MDFTLISASIVTGVITSIIFNGLMGHGQDKSKGKSDISQLSSSAANIQVLESLKIENDIIKEGIAKIYEAFSGDKISKLEYDRLMVKYTEDLRICDERIKDLQPIIDIFELKDLRNGLVSLIENRIKNIDEKLDKLSSTTIEILWNTNQWYRPHFQRITTCQTGCNQIPEVWRSNSTIC